MIATFVTFITTRIVAVFITTIVVVAAVPMLIIAIHGNTITITTAVASSTRLQGDDEHARVVLEVKNAGDAVLVKINTEEASCDSQIAQLASLSKLSATATQAALDKGKADFHTATVPFRDEIKADEDQIDHLTVITTETEQTFLVRVSTVLVTAVGEDGHSGTLITICQTVLIEVQQIIIVVQSGGDGDGDSD